LEEDKKQFDFGIFLDALQSGVVESRDFTDKLFYCFWWGLKNLRCASLILFTISHYLIFCNGFFILFGNLDAFIAVLLARTWQRVPIFGKSISQFSFP
jgi:cyclic nucleotide gated channel